MPTDQPITEYELAILRSRFTRSGYANVYYRSPQTSGEVPRYFARVRSHREVFYLGCRQRARDAAKLVAQWYKNHHGPQWEAAFRQRKAIGRMGKAASTRTA